jgi:EAL domain-containing protein (putative c-di-GMP-specific phosphodiesterase class I)
MQFRDPSLLDDIDHALSASRLPAELLSLEITEGMVMENVESAIALMDAIKARGVALVLDDFGQGYSSLSYLKRFPLAAVKIDRAFVEGLCDSPADQAIVRSVVSLARELDMTVTAEGIETPQQLAHVRRLGCDDVQGYLLCRPVAAPDLRGHLARPSRAVIESLTTHLD